jgi:hypothetical protein
MRCGDRGDWSDHDATGLLDGRGEVQGNRRLVLDDQNLAALQRRGFRRHGLTRH